MSSSKSLQEQHPNRNTSTNGRSEFYSKAKQKKRNFADYGFNVWLFLNLYG